MTRETVEVDLDAPVVEWIELETDDETVAEWIERQVFVALTEDLKQHHAPVAEVSVDVPADYAERVALFASLKPYDAISAEGVALDHLEWDHTWTVEGEPWDLLEGDD